MEPMEQQEGRDNTSGGIKKSSKAPESEHRR